MLGDRFHSTKQRTQSDASCGRSVHTYKELHASPSSSSSNVERFLESVTPSVPAQYHPKTMVKERRCSDVVELQQPPPYFVLGDVWESFAEWSAYGGLTMIQIFKDLSRLKRFNSEEAIEYGLIIVRPPRIKDDAPLQDGTSGLG